MKQLIIVLLTLILSVGGFAQKNVPIINAQIGGELNDAIYKKWSEIEKIFAKQYNEKGERTGNLDQSDIKRLGLLLGVDLSDTDSSAIYPDDYGPYPWNVYDWGCSWYCGAMYGTEVSSSLPPNGNNVYNASSLSDDDTRTAWVEGVKGYGIGEYILFKFPYNAARATSVGLVNGYAKNEKTWKNNSRVKTFNLYENERLIATVNLNDKMDWQIFNLPHPIPNRPDGWQHNSPIPQGQDTIYLKFMITDVYPGDKYDDTAISAFIFNGIDVHCLAEGTQIAIKDSTVNIEDLKVGDKIEAIKLSETGGGKYYPDAIITAIHKATHKAMLRLTLENGMEITATPDHPFYTAIGWASFDPEKTRLYDRYKNSDIKAYEIGVEFYADPENSSPLKSIEILEGKYKSYSLELNSPQLWYIANGFLVGQE